MVESILGYPMTPLKDLLRKEHTHLTGRLRGRAGKVSIMFPGRNNLTSKNVNGQVES
jgi:hypothetical protein